MAGFATRLVRECWEGMQIMNKNKLTKGRLKKTVILDYRGWQILLEPGFPSHNYVLTKKNASHGFRPAYCGSLESALSMLFEQLIITNIKEDSSYGKNFTDLRDVIIRTKNEFKGLLSNDVKRLTCEGGDDF